MIASYERTAIQTEQEAAVAILFSCLAHDPDNSKKEMVEHISRMLLLSSKFIGHSLPTLADKALPIVSSERNERIIAHCAPYISEGFKETLFAMICELLTADGRLSQRESEQVGLAALYLGVSIEMMQVMVNTFLIRNRYNI